MNSSPSYNPLGLIQGTDRNLYGATQLSAGTIFTITPSGTLTTLTTLFTFNGLNNDGGISPGVGLVQGTDGDSYGTTYSGGADQACNLGCGRVFKITPGGTLTRTSHYPSS
jgi:hypothetical protein